MAAAGTVTPMPCDERELRAHHRNGEASSNLVRSGEPAWEEHYSIGKLAQLWGVGRETIRLLVKNEPGVLAIRLGRKQRHARYSIPASVAIRIHTKLRLR